MGPGGHLSSLHRRRAPSNAPTRHSRQACEVVNAMGAADCHRSHARLSTSWRDQGYVSHCTEAARRPRAADSQGGRMDIARSGESLSRGSGWLSEETLSKHVADDAPVCHRAVPRGGKKEDVERRLARLRPADFQTLTRYVTPTRFRGSCHLSPVQRLHHLVQHPRQVFVGALQLVDLSDRVHHGRVMFAAELPPDFR